MFFPERIAGKSGPDGKVNLIHSTVISDIRVNQPLPENAFQFRYPRGIYLSDHIAGRYYRVDPEGNRIGPATAVGSSTPSEPGEQLPGGIETQEEPQRLTRWILPVSLAILVIAAAVALLRRWRLTTSG